MRYFIPPFCLLLSACMQPTVNEMPSRAATSGTGAVTSIKAFPSARPVAPTRSNRDIARDFIDLSFRLESGRELPVFTRFERPIRVEVTGAAPATLLPDLNRLISRLRNEAGIDIALARSGPANITIEAVSRSQINRHLPQAACFVVPNISRLSEYRRARHSQATNWALLRQRDRIAIFIPNDTGPQEVRDCLHEELAQAIGPLNDLYRLPDSVFNDDNVHTVLSGFDMLILRAYYAPELRSGMTRQQVQARLPGILARLNPRGNALPSHQASDTPRSWIRAIQTALGPGSSPAKRRASAAQAVNIATAMGWQDHRLAFSHYALGRLSQRTDPEYARRQFVIADNIYRRHSDMALHRAHTASQLSAYAIAGGRGSDALAMLAPHLATAARHENAALLATLMMLRAEALELQGRTAEARAVRLDSLGWARYGFGADWAVRAKLRDIAALNPRKGRDG